MVCEYWMYQILELQARSNEEQRDYLKQLFDYKIKEERKRIIELIKIIPESEITERGQFNNKYFENELDKLFAKEGKCDEVGK
jgi:hypothetical protein